MITLSSWFSMCSTERIGEKDSSLTFMKGNVYHELVSGVETLESRVSSERTKILIQRVKPVRFSRSCGDNMKSHELMIRAFLHISLHSNLPLLAFINAFFFLQWSSPQGVWAFFPPEGTNS